MEYHRVFYINVDGMENHQAGEWINSVVKDIQSQYSDPNITDYILPVKNQPTKIEFINPKLITKKQLQKDLNASVEELTSHLKDEIIQLHPHANSRINPTTDLIRKIGVD